MKPGGSERRESLIRRVKCGIYDRQQITCLVKFPEYKLRWFSVKNAKSYPLPTHYKIVAITTKPDASLSQHPEAKCDSVRVLLVGTLSPQKCTSRKTGSFACLGLFPGPEPEQKLKFLLVE